MKYHDVTYFHKHFTPLANVSQNSEKKQFTIIFLQILISSGRKKKKPHILMIKCQSKKRQKSFFIKHKLNCI